MGPSASSDPRRSTKRRRRLSQRFWIPLVVLQLSIVFVWEHRQGSFIFQVDPTIPGDSSHSSSSFLSQQQQEEEDLRDAFVVQKGGGRGGGGRSSSTVLRQSSLSSHYTNLSRVSIFPPLDDLLRKNGSVIYDIVQEATIFPQNTTDNDAWRSSLDYRRLTSIQFLLDFAIIGFPKCATTTLMNWLHQHSSIQVVQEEVWGFLYGKPQRVIRRMYNALPHDYYYTYTDNNNNSTKDSNGHQRNWNHAALVQQFTHGQLTTTQDHYDSEEQAVQADEEWARQQQQQQQQQQSSNMTGTPRIHKYLRGYKCPADITGNHVFANYYTNLFPKTQLLLGIRHPLFWFQSLYNFRVQNLEDGLPHPNKLIGLCRAGRKHTCTEKGNYAIDILRMGKTNMFGARPPSELEDDILGRYHKVMWFNVTAVPSVPNNVFVYDTSELEVSNQTASTIANQIQNPKAFLQTTRQHVQDFSTDIQHYLGLTTPLPPIVHSKPGKIVTNQTLQDAKDALKIHDICHEEYLPVRTELLEIARLNSLWIRNVFLQLPTVYSSPRLHQILETWMYDPCSPLNETTTTTTTATS